MKRFFRSHRPTFALSGDLVPEDVDLVDGTKVLKHPAQVRLVHGSRDLTHEHLDRVLVGLVRGAAVAADADRVVVDALGVGDD